MLPFSGHLRRPHPPAPFSSLSPSAAPFTVDRPYPPPLSFPDPDPIPTPNPNLPHPTAPSFYISPPPPPPPIADPIYDPNAFYRSYAAGSGGGGGGGGHAHFDETGPADLIRSRQPASGVVGAWRSASWIDPPVSYMAPVSAPAAAAPGYEGGTNSDGFMAPENAPRDVFSRNHFSSSGEVQPFRSNSSEWPTEKYPGIYQESAEAPSNGFGLSLVHCLNTVADSLIAEGTEPRPVSQAPQPFNQLHAGSAYDNYMKQLSSCSMDPLTLKLPKASAVSSEVCGLAESSTSGVDDTIFESVFSFPPYVNPCRINFEYFDCTRGEQKEHGYWNADKHYGDCGNSTVSMTTVGNSASSSLGEKYIVGDPVQSCSEMRSGLRNLQSTYSEISPSAVGFLEPNEFSSESVELHNPIVDSPCWKGTPAAYHPSFCSAGNENAPIAAKGSGDCNDWLQNLLPFITKYSGLRSECQEAPTSENGHALSFHADRFAALSSPIVCEKSEDRNGRDSLVAEACNNKAGHVGYIFEEPPSKREKHMTDDSAQDAMNVTNSHKKESVLSVNNTMVSDEHFCSHIASITEEPRNEVLNFIAAAANAHAKNPVKERQEETLSSISEVIATNDNVCPERPLKVAVQKDSSSCNVGAAENMMKTSSDCATSSTRKEAEFIKSMHNLSVMLLSTCDRDYALGESEHELLQSVIENLKAFSSKSIARFEINADDCIGNSGRTKLESIRPEKSIDLVSENIDTDFNKFLSQALKKLPEDNMLGDTEDAQALLYKNLWIEAEATICRMKYELQLARMKLAMKDHNYQRKVSVGSLGVDQASNVTISKSSSSIRGLHERSRPENNAKESIDCTPDLQHQKGDSGDGQSPEVNGSMSDGVDAAVMARLRILKSRNDHTTSLCEENSKQHQEASKNNTYGVADAFMSREGILKSSNDNMTSFGEDSSKQHQEASENKADGFDGAVMSRLRVLKSRNDNMTSSDEDRSEQHQKASENKADVFDDATMSRPSVLKYSNDNMTSVGEDSRRQHQETSKNKVDGFDNTIMSRLRILKSRNDIITCLGEDSSKQHQEEIIKKADVIDDAVMPRLRVLKGRIEHTGAEGHQKLLHSGDGVGYFTGAICGGENNGSTNIADLTTLGQNRDMHPCNEHKAPPDGVDSKSAVRDLNTCQCEDGFVISNCIWPEAEEGSPVYIADSPALHLHGEHLSHSSVRQSPSSSAEWEHVLKEDFFRPGNP